MTDPTPCTIADVEGFGALISMARDNEAVRHFLCATLNSAPTERHAKIQALANQLAIDRAPPQLVAAVLCLRDDGVAEQALRLLDEAG